jgi:hypothetical protein
MCESKRQAQAQASSREYTIGLAMMSAENYHVKLLACQFAEITKTLLDASRRF